MSARRMAPTSRLARVLLAAGSLALALAAVEALLAARWIPLSPAAGMYVHGCYEKSQPARFVHGSLRPLKVSIHRPDFEADCYSMGHAWSHRSDGWGFRNPETWETADVVLLGDSMVYGHGVEEHQTAAHFLRSELDARVVNMGISGGSPVHYLAYLNNFVLPLEPRVVVILTFGNDLRDVRKMRPMPKIRRFARTGKGREARVFQRDELLAQISYPVYEASWHDRFALSRWLEYNVRAKDRRRPGAADRRAQDRRPSPKTRRAGRAGPPPPEVLDRMERLFTARYLRRTLVEMAIASRASGAALVVGHIGKRSDLDWFLRRLLEESAREHGLHYFDTPELLGSFRLPRDGHYNESGHRALAEELAGYLRASGLVDSANDPASSDSAALR